LGQKSPFLAKRHEALLTDLVNFIIARQGIALIEGESGVGKTVLAHALVQRIPKNFQFLVISGPPAGDPLALTVSIAQAMGINIRDKNLVHLNRLTDMVLAAAERGKFYVVLLDDAHDLTDQHLEEIWVLSQMELYGKLLLPFILVAHPTLSQRFAGQTDQHLGKLIDKKFNLTGLTSDETLLYIDHQLHQAGSSFQACFAGDCINQLLVLTGGSPRQINTMCHQALERCWHEHLFRVTPEILVEKGQAPDPKGCGPTAKTRFWSIFGATTGVVLTGVALGVSLAAYALYNNLAGKMSLPDNAISETMAHDKPNPLKEQAHLSPDSPTPLTSSEPTDRKAVRQPAPPKPEPLVSSAQQASKEASGSEALLAPQPKISPEEMTWSTSISYRVTAKDHNLSKIVAAHYPNKEKLGFDATILANPQIITEDLIYRGHVLILPEINKSNNIIKLKENQYYSFYNRYSKEYEFNNALSKLQKLKIRCLSRETQSYTVDKSYRIYIGGYESEEDIKEILTLIKDN
jgi:type II secretory pathway predicted ATPase ExeA